MNGVGYTLSDNTVAQVNAIVLARATATGPIGAVWQASAGIIGYAGAQPTFMGPPVYSYCGTATGSVPSGTNARIAIGTGTASGTFNVLVTGQTGVAYNWLADVQVIERS